MNDPPQVEHVFLGPYSSLYSNFQVKLAGTVYFKLDIDVSLIPLINSIFTALVLKLLSRKTFHTFSCHFPHSLALLAASFFAAPD